MLLANAFTIFASGREMTDASKFYQRILARGGALPMTKSSIPLDLAADIECYLLRDWYLYYQREFLIECERVGLKFIRDWIDPEDRERFTNAFDELTTLGCRPLLLASSLYFYERSRIYDFPNEFPNDGQLVPRFVGFERLPSSKEIGSRMRALQEAVTVIEWLNESGVGWLLSKQVQPPAHHDRVLETLRWYAQVLKSWSKPRSDVTRSFGPIACCMYAQLATAKFRFPLVSDLIECFGYKPDAKRQHRKAKREATRVLNRLSGGDVVDRDGYEPTFESLERNFRVFKASHPRIYRELRRLLAVDHAAEHTRHPEKVCWDEVFVPFGKYDYRKWRVPR
jgi:hypothetical protein